jgi:hypothetical protein
MDWKHKPGRKTVLFLLFLVYATHAMPDVSKKTPELNLSRFHIFNEAILTIPGDFVEMGKYPVQHPWVTVGVLGVTLGLVASDKPTTEFIQHNFNTDWPPPYVPYSDYVLYNASPEDGYLLAGLGGLYLQGNLFNSPVNQIAALASIKSVAYSIVISQLVLKTVFGRIRPNPNLSNNAIPYDPTCYTNNPWDFFRKNVVIMNTGSGPTSMPSYHFTQFFAVGSALSQAYNSYWPYLITAAGLLPNFQGHHHWTSDMFAGAAIGTLIGYAVTNNLKNTLGVGVDSGFSLEPALTTHGASIKYSVQFD